VSQPSKLPRVPVHGGLARILIAMVMAVGLVIVIEPVSAADTTGSAAWRATLAVSADKVAPGGTVRLDVTVTSETDAQALVDVEVLDSNGARTFQRFWDKVAFVSGRPQAFTTTWTAPARIGRYRVVVRVYGPNWAGLLFGDERAGTVRVSRQVPATTTTVAATTTTAASSSTTTTTIAPTTTRATTTTSSTPAPTTTRAPTTSSSSTTTTPTSPPPTGATFFEDFTGDDIEDFKATFDWSVVDLWRGDGSWQGHHDMNCGVPTTERRLHHAPISNTDPGVEFWMCGPNGPTSDHLMTSNGDNHTFGVTAFSPKPSFSGNRVCWDVNLTVSPGRRLWWEVQLVPAAAVTNARSLASLGLTVNGVDFERGSAYVAWGIGIDGTYMKRPNPPTGIIFDFTEEMVRIWRGQTLIFNPGNGWEPGVRYVTTDRATRAHHCMVDHGNGTMTLTQQRGAETYTRTVPVSFPKPYRVIFSAQNYNAGKDGTASNQTWHWDNILVSS
jgi:hypothetical protein